MRLGTCIALELVTAAAVVGGAWIGVDRTIAASGTYFASHASAAVATSDRRAPSPLPGAQLHVALPALASTVFDASDDILLAPLGATPVTQVKLNRGGTSLSLRLDFASGARAAFKPEQIHPQSDPRREIAAFRIDRLLGIGHVPPARTVKLAIDDLIAATDPALRTYTVNRLAAEAIARGGTVRGELSWWIPEIRDAVLDGAPIDTPAGMAQWASYLQAGVVIPPALRPLLAQIATCVVFDVVIDNADRWSGNNTKASVDRQTLYFMDNTLAFSAFTLGHEMNLTPLRRISVFPRRLLSRLRTLTLPMLTAALDLGEDQTGLAPLLAPAEIRAILSRRDHLVDYVDQLIAQFGEDAVLALP